MKIFSLFLAIVILLSSSLRAQSNPFEISPKGMILPIALIGAGAIGSQIDAIKEIDFGLPKSPIHSHSGFVLEDAVQYAPVGAFYALNMCGVKSAHGVADGTALVAASYCITAAATYALKLAVDERRPNGVDYDAFPSGHTATSFMGAEFLRMQYKDASPWIGIAGYALASGTALARIAHNEHWLTDVIAGAGVGILSTRVAYWIYPWVQEKIVHKIFKPKKDMAFVGLPYYSGEGAGISLAMRF